MAADTSHVDAHGPGPHGFTRDTCTRTEPHRKANPLAGYGGPALGRRASTPAVSLSPTVATALVDLTKGASPRPAGLPPWGHTRLVRWARRGTPIVPVHGFASNAEVCTADRAGSPDHAVYPYDVVNWATPAG